MEVVAIVTDYTMSGLYSTNEEIIRCRDCKKAKEPNLVRQCAWYLFNNCDPNGFCAWAERVD